MTVLERVAAAIATNPSDPARAAVEALREPSVEMSEQGAAAILVHTTADFCDASDAWRAMIDAILKGAEVST